MVKYWYYKDRYKRLAAIVLLTFITTVVTRCNSRQKYTNASHAIYHWKSTIHISDYEQGVLDTLNIHTIYLKLFDVAWSASTKQALPVAKIITGNSTQLSKFSITPTVFITNECLQNLDTVQTNLLADKTEALIKDICKQMGLVEVNEIQIDCDWTPGTKEKYFSFLQQIKKLLPNTLLSVTIRLHQIKYSTKTGVPPADKGLLMCYNMGNLKNPATKNSIIETAELKKYVSGLSTYPLPFDVALPLFGWHVLFRNNMYKGLIENLPADAFHSSFSFKKNNTIRILKDSLLYGYELKKGDVLRQEESDIAEVMASAKIIRQHLKQGTERVALYHLDSLTLCKYKLHELESIYNSFN